MNPLVRQFFDLLKDAQVSRAELSRRSGWDRNNYYNWHKGNNGPTVGALSDSLQVIGYELRIVKCEDGERFAE